jgi:hypothetical protein
MIDRLGALGPASDPGHGRLAVLCGGGVPRLHSQAESQPCDKSCLASGCILDHAHCAVLSTSPAEPYAPVDIRRFDTDLLNMNFNLNLVPHYCLPGWRRRETDSMIAVAASMATYEVDCRSRRQFW